MTTTRRVRIGTTLLVVAVTLLFGSRLKADEIRVLTTGAFEAPYLELVAPFERTTGHKVIALGTSMGVGTGSIPNRIRRGEPADVVVLSDAIFTELTKEGRIVAGTRVVLARSGIGMAVRRGAPRPDISSVDAFKRALLQAESIAYSAQTSGIYLSTELFPRLGIAEQVKARSRRIDHERVGAVVARGEAELGFQQISELLPIAGIDYVGPLPPEIQRMTEFSAGVVAGAKSPEAARALIEYFASPAGVQAMKKTGLEPIAGRSRPH
jgi:molybdate transport system substrate-binding protein